MQIFLGLIALLVIAPLIAALAQEWRYHRKRRDIVMDRQQPFHDKAALHVVTALKLAADQELLPAVRQFVEGVESTGAQVVYAGKSVFTGTQAKQVPKEEWDAFVMSQFPSRAAWDAFAGSAGYEQLRKSFGHSWSIGMRRNPTQHLMLPLALLAMKIRQIVTGEARRFPFVATDDPVTLRDKDGEKVDPALRKMYLESVVKENARYSENAMVIVNFQKDGNAEQKKSDAGYGNEMFALMAEVGHGPTHMGKAVSLEDDVDFDRIILVYYPGVKYFVDMVQSTFYNEIFGGKQLGDNQSTPTVPILQHL